jgi:hypothetical protein
MKNKYIPIALVLIVAILLVLVASFVFDIRRLHTNGVFNYTHSAHGFYRLGPRPATLSDVNLIAPWMTFDYINKSFNLPADYLKTTLGISNPSYPHLVISKTAGEFSFSTSTYLENIKNAVSSYLTQNSLPK